MYFLLKYLTYVLGYTVPTDLILLEKARHFHVVTYLQCADQTPNLRGSDPLAESEFEMFFPDSDSDPVLVQYSTGSSGLQIPY